MGQPVQLQSMVLKALELQIYKLKVIFYLGNRKEKSGKPAQ